MQIQVFKLVNIFFFSPMTCTYWKWLLKQLLKLLNYSIIPFKFSKEKYFAMQPHTNTTEKEVIL